jgi:hypothetical protein
MVLVTLSMAILCMLFIFLIAPFDPAVQTLSSVVYIGRVQMSTAYRVLGMATARYKRFISMTGIPKEQEERHLSCRV